ncbi:hypothetical protein LPU83_pLPU83c_0249 (plasmid) [Rhizobium favelukesii]|uniref:Uncharacterized protein n=1 Tax=Rhizobium favelukesii TaxID=348824 RepID=W6S360_9HYPH|nr:hypothetical protein LPU83_pLPU83c_0249 [Rhizobium favelukesii]
MSVRDALLFRKGTSSKALGHRLFFGQRWVSSWNFRAASSSLLSERRPCEPDAAGMVITAVFRFLAAGNETPGEQL